MRILLLEPLSSPIMNLNQDGSDERVPYPSGSGGGE